MHNLLLLAPLMVGGIGGAFLSRKLLNKRHAQMKDAYAREVQRRNDTDAANHDLTVKVAMATNGRDTNGRFKKRTPPPEPL